MDKLWNNIFYTLLVLSLCASGCLSVCLCFCFSFCLSLNFKRNHEKYFHRTHTQNIKYTPKLTRYSHGTPHTQGVSLPSGANTGNTTRSELGIPIHASYPSSQGKTAFYTGLIQKNTKTHQFTEDLPMSFPNFTSTFKHHFCWTVGNSSTEIHGPQVHFSHHPQLTQFCQLRAKSLTQSQNQIPKINILKWYIKRDRYL